MKNDVSSEGSKAKKLSKSKSAVAPNEVSMNDASPPLIKSNLDNGLSNISKAEITLFSDLDRSKDGLRNEKDTESMLDNGPINVPVQYTQVNGHNQNSNTLEVREKKVISINSKQKQQHQIKIKSILIELIINKGPNYCNYLAYQN